MPQRCFLSVTVMYLHVTLVKEPVCPTTRGRCHTSLSPSSHKNQIQDNKTWIYNIHRKFNLPVHQGQFNCPDCNKRMDNMGDHPFSCNKKSQINARHNGIRDCLGRLCQQLVFERSGAELLKKIAHKMCLQVNKKAHECLSEITTSLSSILQKCNGQMIANAYTTLSFNY